MTWNIVAKNEKKKEIVWIMRITQISIYLVGNGTGERCPLKFVKICCHEDNRTYFTDSIGVFST